MDYGLNNSTGFLGGGLSGVKSTEQMSLALLIIALVVLVTASFMFMFRNMVVMMVMYLAMAPSVPILLIQMTIRLCVYCLRGAGSGTRGPYSLRRRGTAIAHLASITYCALPLTPQVGFMESP